MLSLKVILRYGNLTAHKYKYCDIDKRVRRTLTYPDSLEGGVGRERETTVVVLWAYAPIRVTKT